MLKLPPFDKGGGGKAVKNHIKILAVLLSIALAACGPGEQTTGEPAAEAPAANAAEYAANQISSEFIRKIVKEIADDRYEGRGPGSRGDVAARQYLARELEALGLEPGAADGSWEQEFVLVSVDSKQPDHWAFRRGDETLTFKQWDDFIVNSDVQQERAEFGESEVVFVGYGMQAPEFDWFQLNIDPIHSLGDGFLHLYRDLFPQRVRRLCWTRRWGRWPRRARRGGCLSAESGLHWRQGAGRAILYDDPLRPDRA